MPIQKKSYAPKQTVTRGRITPVPKRTKPDFVGIEKKPILIPKTTPARKGPTLSRKKR